jgi:molecular chaperone DnaK (HSP70)
VPFSVAATCDRDVAASHPRAHACVVRARFNDASVQDDMKLWPFQVVEVGDNQPAVNITVGGVTRTFRPEEISAMILKWIKVR